jgi:predicted SAM-dependent methyltransferase
MSAPTILNLGCGSKTSPRTVNIDFSVYQRIRKSPAGKVIAVVAVRGERRKQFESMDDNLVVHDLRKGIPAADNSVDAVYHSHTQEHIDREVIPAFFAEILRVLRPGGVHRIVVPDLEALARDYLASLESCRDGHDETVYSIIGQSVRREAFGTSRQAPLRRRLENLVLGDARKRGETQQWMWDRCNLRQALEEAGFVGAKQVDAYTSDIPDWGAIGLDLNPDGSAYKPDSLFMEARKAGRANAPARQVIAA